MKYIGFDHIVISCHDVDAMVGFYRDVLRAEVREERVVKWAIWFGRNKISLQNEAAKPDLAVHTTPGTGNYCVLCETDITEVTAMLESAGVDILESGRKVGAQGPIESVYFRDPEGNLVEISNQI